jgi:putative ABC transport system permease protein
VRALDRKLLRDLWRLRAPLGAAALVMASGVAALVMAWSTSASLAASRARYYEEGRFGDVFAQVKRAPEFVAGRLREIDGVEMLETRIMHDVMLTVPGLDETASARLVSLPDAGEPLLNAVHLRVGRMPDPRQSEVIASEPFAAANGLRPGDTLGAVINGRWQTLTVVGIGLSPEFIYFVRAGSMLPDNRRSGVLWMPRSGLEDALGMKGAFNDLAIRLADGAESRAVIRGLDTLLERYGGFGAYDRTDHLSDRYLRDEFDQLKVMGTWTPVIFLGVAAFLINVVLGRLIRTQREEIATLKAFGYTNAMLARHVLLMGAAVCAVAVAIGVAGGAALGTYLTSFYVEVFRFPLLSFALDPRAVAIGAAVALGASAIGALGALRAMARLAPAEAMRPEAPGRWGGGVLGRFGSKYAPIRWRMAFRAVGSHPWRSAFAALGIALSTAVLLVSSFPLDSIDALLEREYEASQRQDLTVVLNEPVSDSALSSFRGLLAGDATLLAEPIRVATAKIGSGHVVRNAAIIGIDPDATLQRPLDRSSRPVAVPSDGLLLSEHFAEVLGVRPGEAVEVRFLEGRRVRAMVPVAGVFSGHVGLAAYMHRDALNRLTRDGHVLSSVLVREQPAHARELHDTLRRMPAVAAVLGKRATVEEFRAVIARNIVEITMLHALFAGVIAFGVVFNTGRIALAERRREFATLRVLGFSRAEVGRVLIAEIAILTAAGIPIGLFLGKTLAGWLLEALRTESYDLPLVISATTYSMAALVTLLAAACSAVFMRRAIARLDLLSTLKEAG